MTIEMDKRNTEGAESPNTALPAAASPAANDLASASFSLGAREEAVLENVISEGNEIVNFPWKGGHSAQTEPEALGDSVALSQETKEDSVAGALFFGPTTREFKLGEPLFPKGKYTDAGGPVAGSSGPYSVETHPQRVPSTGGHDDQSVPFTLPIRSKAA